MLQVLRKHDPEEVQRILSSLTSELLPNPEVGRGASHVSVDPDVQSEVWKEIRRRVKVDPLDASLQARGKVFEFLFSEMSQIALPKSGLESVKANLSFRGELRPDLYDVKFHPSFEISEAHGARRNHVLEAIRNSKDVEHLNLLDNEALISIFVRVHNDFSAENRFVLLVLARRIGAHLLVYDALRIYLSEVDISGAQRPVDILRRVVEKYGFVMTIGHISDKLILGATVTVVGLFDPDKFVKVHAPEGAKILGDVQWLKRRLFNSYGVPIAYALDQTRYADDLRKHGVRVNDADRDFRVALNLSADLISPKT
jgi:hypothetical protein